MRPPHIADRRSRTSLGTTASVQPGPHRMQKTSHCEVIGRHPNNFAEHRTPLRRWLHAIGYSFAECPSSRGHASDTGWESAGRSASCSSVRRAYSSIRLPSGSFSQSSCSGVPIHVVRGGFSMCHPARPAR